MARFKNLQQSGNQIPSIAVLPPSLLSLQEMTKGSFTSKLQIISNTKFATKDGS